MLKERVYTPSGTSGAINKSLLSLDNLPTIPSTVAARIVYEGARRTTPQNAPALPQRCRERHDHGRLDRNSACQARRTVGRLPDRQDLSLVRSV
jgi:hypothetical protein